jgi:hypothetical protein
VGSTRDGRTNQALTTQIARYLEKELNLKAEERRERTQRLGIEWEIAEQAAEDQS